MADQVVTNMSAPWEPLQPFLTHGFDRARQLLDQGGPSYFPGSTVAPFSGQTEDALAGIEATARAGTPLPGAAADNLAATLRGDFLTANPYLGDIYDAAAGRATEHYREAVAPSIAARFGMSGRTGSNMAFANTMANSQGELADSLAMMGANLYGQNYQQERGRQMQAAGLAPAIAPMAYYDNNQLLGVGEMRDAQTQREIGDDFTRFMFEQERPYDALARYMGNLGGGYGQTNTAPYNRTADILGQGLTYAGLLNEYGDDVSRFLQGLF